MTIIFALVFLASCLLLMYAGNWLVRALSNISGFLGWKEFTVAFVLMSISTASPELFIGIGSALRGIPELSLGNIIGQNIIHFTVAIFVLSMIRGSFSVSSQATKSATYFSVFMAVFPLLLVLDGSLSRIDGIILLMVFGAYIIRLIKHSHRYTDVYKEDGAIISHAAHPLLVRLQLFFKNIGLLLIGVIILLIATQGIIRSSIYFVDLFDISLVVAGAIIVGLGTSLPELYFSALSARKGETEMMAGNLLGSTVVSTSLVLGIVSIIQPITNITLYSYATSRIFLFISACLFLIFIYSDKKITRKEGVALLLLYVIFVLFETSI